VVVVALLLVQAPLTRGEQKREKEEKIRAYYDYVGVPVGEDTSKKHFRYNSSATLLRFQ